MVHFISGIDTDAGKSIATGWLAARLQAQGKRVITQKLVQTGNVGFSEDIARHRAMMGGVSFPEDKEGLTATEIFSYPCSPHLAAHIDGRAVNLDRITSATQTLNARYDEVLLEGAGGLMVPLTENYLTLDYLQQCGYPLIFVTGGILGSISHTLLAFEVLAARKIPVEQIIYNRYPGRKDLTIDNASHDYLKAAAAERFPSATWDELPILEAL